MRTLQEKYNAVLEGNFSKTQFRRDAAIELPQFVSNVNSFDDTVAILKNKGIVTEAKKQEPKYSTAKPADTIAPDVLDTGIKFELDKKYGTLDVTPEQYEKAKEAAVKNLAKDVLYYVKQDSIQLDTPGEKMEKAKLKEGKAEAWEEYQKKYGVTNKTIKVAEKDFDKKWYDLVDAVADGEGLEGASAQELKIYAQIATRLEDHIDVVNAFEYLESLPNYSPKFTPQELRKVSKVKVQKTFADGREELALDGQEMSDKEADEFIARAKAHGATPMGTKFTKVNETVDTDELRARIANILKGQLTSLRKMGGDAIIEDYIETQIQAYLNGDVDIEKPMEVVNDFRYYMDDNQSAAADFNADLEPNDTTPETLEEDDEESPEEEANKHAGSPMHSPPGLEENSELAKLKAHRAQIMRDMEQEAEMDGGPMADKYGAMLNKIDKAIAQLQGTKKEKEYKLMEAETYTAQNGRKYKKSYNLYVNGERVANFEDQAKADAELKKYQEKYKDSKEVASSSIFIKGATDPVNEDYDSAERVDEQAENLQSAVQKIEEKLKALGLQTKVFEGEFEVPKNARDMIEKNPKLGALSYLRDKSIIAGQPESERLEVVVHKAHFEDLKKIASEFKMPPGSVQAFAGTDFVRLRHNADVVAEGTYSRETLKEMFKKIIAKIITE